MTGLNSSDDRCATLSLVTQTGQVAGYQRGCGNASTVGVGPVTLTSSGTWSALLQLDTIATGSAHLKVTT